MNALKSCKKILLSRNFVIKGLHQRTHRSFCTKVTKPEAASRWNPKYNKYAIGTLTTVGIFGYLSNLNSRDNALYVDYTHTHASNNNGYNTPEKRCIDMLDLWSDKECGMYGMTYFMRIMNKNYWDLKDGKYNIDDIKYINNMWCQLVSYVCSADGMSQIEHDLLLKTELLWAGQSRTKQQIEISIKEGTKLDEKNALKLAESLKTSLRSKGILNCILYYALIMAEGDGTTQEELKRFMAIAKQMDVDGDEILKIFKMEKRFHNQMKLVFGVNNR